MGRPFEMYELDIETLDVRAGPIKWRRRAGRDGQEVEGDGGEAGRRLELERYPQSTEFEPIA